jgi:hypothetical protein
MALSGVGLFQARLLGVLLGLGIVTMVAVMGRRTIDPLTGLSAALFLALDSNFLGGVRNARTDIPSVFFGTAALLAYILGRQQSRKSWFMGAGACLGLAVLCHGNAFWVGLVLLAWYLLDYGRRALVEPFGYAFLGGLVMTFGPYLAILLMRWREVQVQIGNFAADRVPGWQPAFVLHQMTQEIQRYRGWYFGLVTNAVPNPLLWAFQLAIGIGIVALIFRARARNGRPMADPRGALRLLVLAVGGAFIFAGFINNKVPVYMPHLLVGFSLAAGCAVSEAAYLARQALAKRGTRLNVHQVMRIAMWAFIIGYGGAGVAYYEKWYSTVRKSELVPFEATVATLRTLVPAGPKYLYASPQFWPPFHAEPGTTFYSYAAAQPVDSGSTIDLAGANDDRPIFLLVDEFQWLPELTGISSSTLGWQHDWVAFIERRCALDGAAFGTAHGTIALYRCALGAAPRATTPRIVGGTTEYRISERVMTQTAANLAEWPRYEDPRRTAASRPDVRTAGNGLRIGGTGWPGIVTTFAASPGDCYLVRTGTERTRDGDLLYLGTWRQPQVRSLAGASSSGIPAPLLREPWFPRDRAFVATTPAVSLVVYSEAPETDFVITSLEIYRLRPVEAQR